MGMFIDESNKKREAWTYEYSGKDLLPQVQRLRTIFLKKEMDARERMAGFMKDINVSQSDPEVDRAKREITTNGPLREQCEVWIHEFTREPDRKYTLGIGDVSFFGLNNHS